MSRLYRFFSKELAEAELEGDINLSPRCETAIFEQLVKVLRVKPGNEVVLIPQKYEPFDGKSLPKYEYRFTVESAHKKEVSLRFSEKIENQNELSFQLELVLCLPAKPEKLSMILQKAVELGATRVTLVQAAFSQMKHALREDRLQKIMKEAAEQSERALVPDVVLAGDLKEYLQKASERLLVAMEREDEKGLSDLLGDFDVSILVGPEGGFSDEEKGIIQARGLPCFSLGKRILRMETAAILALGIASLK